MWYITNKWNDELFDYFEKIQHSPNKTDYLMKMKKKYPPDIKNLEIKYGCFPMKYEFRESQTVKLLGKINVTIKKRLKPRWLKRSLPCVILLP